MNVCATGLHETKPVEDGLSLAKDWGTLGTAQDFAKFLQLAGSFVLHDTVDSLGSFRFTWSLTHAPAVISPRNSVLPQMVSP